MSAYVTQQHRLAHRGRSFHFVSYEAQSADGPHQMLGGPASWYLMLGGKRWLVSAQVDETAPDDLDRQFAAWLDVHACGGEPEPQSLQPPPPRRPRWSTS